MESFDDQLQQQLDAIREAGLYRELRRDGTGAHRWAAAPLTGGNWSLVKTSILGQIEPDELCCSEIKAKRFRLPSV